MYLIPNFMRGLVDKASRSKLTDDYKTRCSELTNFYITKENSVRIRPPVKQELELPGTFNATDYAIIGDVTYVIQELDARSIPSSARISNVFQPEAKVYRLTIYKGQDEAASHILAAQRLTVSQLYIEIGATYVSVDDERAIDRQVSGPRLQNYTDILATHADWDNLLTKIEVHDKEVYFNFAGQEFRVTETLELANLYSSRLLATIDANDMEKGLIRTDKQMPELLDLPIKVIDFGTGFSMYPARRATTSYRPTISSPLGRLVQAGRDTRSSTVEENINGQEDAIDDFTYITGPFYADNIARGRDRTTPANGGSRYPMGYYRPSDAKVAEDTISINYGAKGITNHRTGGQNILQQGWGDFIATDEFNANLSRVVSFLKPCITLLSSQKSDEDFTAVIDFKAAYPGTTHVDFDKEIFNFVYNEETHYVFAQPGRADQVSSQVTVEDGDAAFLRGNGRNSGDPGVLFKVQTGNRKDANGNAIYNKFGSYLPSCIRVGNNDRESLQDIQNVRPGESLNRGKTVKSFFMYYDYTQESVKTYLDDVDNIASYINDGNRLTKVLLNRISGELPRKELTNEEILEEITLAKYPQLRRVSGTSMNLLNWAYSVLDYRLPPLDQFDGFTRYASKTILIEEVEDREPLTSELFRDIHTVPTFDRTLITPAGGGYDDAPRISPIPYLVGRGFHFGEFTMTIGPQDNSNTSPPEVRTPTAGQIMRQHGYINTGLNLSPIQANASTSTDIGDSLVYRDVQTNNVLFAPTFLEAKPNTAKYLLHGNAVIEGSSLHLSRLYNDRPDNRLTFNNYVLNYFALNPNLNVEQFRRDSNIPEHLVEGGAFRATEHRFTSPDLFDQTDGVVDVIQDDNIIVGLTNSIRQIYNPNAPTGGFGGGSLETVLSHAGTSTPLRQESRYILGALDDDIFQLSYYREAGGYVHNVVNTDFSPGDEFDMVASLFGRHKLYFFGKKGQTVLYALAMGTGRSPKGVSKLDIGFPVEEIFAFTKDKLALRSNNRIFTMDFSADENTDYRDDSLEYGGLSSTYKCVLQTLPVIEVQGVRPSPFDIMNIVRVAVGTEGFVDFELSIVNDKGRKLTKKGVSNRGRTLDYTSGMTLIEGLNASGTSYPSVRIEKESSKYLSISSMLLEAKNRGQG